MRSRLEPAKRPSHAVGAALFAPWHRREQLARMRVLRRGEELHGRLQLDDGAALYHGDAVADLGCDEG